VGRREGRESSSSSTRLPSSLELTFSSLASLLLPSHLHPLQPLRQHLSRNQNNETLVLTSLLGSQSVDRVVGLSVSPDLSDESDGKSSGLDGNSRSINVSDGDLDGSVVLGVDESSSGGALSGDVKINELAL